MKRLVALLFALCVGLLAFAVSASAHVTVASTDAKQGGYAVLTFRVPTESATASTTKLEVQFPTDAPLAFVGTQPMTGWTEKSTMAKLPEPLKTEDGVVSEAVSRVTWTASGDAAIKPGQFQMFNVQVGPLPEKPTMTFKALQTYSDGKVVSWIETKAPGSSAEPEHPAPVLQLAAATDTSASATPSTQPKVQQVAAKAPSNTGPIVLSIIALVVAAGALGLAVVARARRGAGRVEQ